MACGTLILSSHSLLRFLLPQLRHYLENEISRKNQALLDCLKALGTSEQGDKGESLASRLGPNEGYRFCMRCVACDCVWVW